MKNYQELALVASLALKIRKYQIRSFRGLLETLSHVYLAIGTHLTAAPRIPLQQPQPSYEFILRSFRGILLAQN